jgi:cold shock CspA family protein
METPVQVTFHGVEHSSAIESYVLTRADKLETFYPRVVHCRVAIESPHKHGHSGRHYRVRVDITVPGEEVAVSRTPDENISNEDAYAAVDAAFDDACRRLEDFARRQRGDVKCHEHHEHALVKKLFTYEGYGFLETGAGDEIYFHRNAVLDHGFDRMKVGSHVTFVQEMGEKGPQASTVALRRN